MGVIKKSGRGALLISSLAQTAAVLEARGKGTMPKCLSCRGANSWVYC